MSAVQAEKTGSLSVSYSATDPVSGQRVSGSWSLWGQGTTGILLAQDGVVAWDKGASAYFRVYDPEAGQWRAGERTFTVAGGSGGSDDLWPELLVAGNGVVGWNNDRSVYFAAFDPRSQTWIHGENAVTFAGGGSGTTVRTMNLTTADGVVAWSRSGSSLVYFSVFDPIRNAWQNGESLGGSSSDPPAVSISNGTVYWGNRSMGYNGSGWIEGPTRPLAYFYASRVSGPPPLRVWFWDGSLGGGARRWDFKDGGSSSAYSLGHVFQEAGLYEVTLIVESNGQTDQFSQTIQVGDPPSAPLIIAGPESQTINEGDDVTLTVSAAGTPPLVYQWFKDGAAITGATAKDLVIAGFETTDAGIYSVRLENAAGTAVSPEAALTMNLRPTARILSPSGSISNAPASISKVTLIPEQTNVIHFWVGDAETPPDQLQIQLNSSNRDLLPEGALSVKGAGTDRILEFAPRAAAEGVADITINVSDLGGAATSRRIAVRIGANLGEWAWQYPSTTSRRVNQIVNGNGVYVAALAHNSILSSKDGVNWHFFQYANGFSNQSSPLAFGSGAFVICGNQIQVSTDGDNWNQASTFPAYSVAYGPGGFVCLGAQEAYGSPTGTNWIRLATIPFSGWKVRRFEWVENRESSVGAGVTGHFMVVGQDGLIATSSDGVDWKVYQAPTTETLFDFAFGNGIYVVTFDVYAQSTAGVLISRDSQNWESVVLPSGGRPESVAFGAGFFCALDGRTALASADGVTWEVTNANLVSGVDGHWFPELAYLNNRFWAGDWGGTILSSQDGVIWAGARSTLIAGSVSSTTDGFFAVGEGGRLYLNENVSGWTVQMAGIDFEMGRAAFSGGEFLVAPGGGFGGENRGKLFKSVDGQSWQSHVAFEAGFNTTDLRSFHDALIAVGRLGTSLQSTGAVFVSRADQQWTRVSANDLPAMWAVVPAETQCYLTGEGGTVLVSENGFDWRPLDVGLTNGLRCGAYGSGYTILAGSGRAVVRSPDQTWTQRSFPLSSPKAVAYGEGIFVAVDFWGTIAVSLDAGESWQMQPSAGQNLEDVEFAHGRFVAVGHNGSILEAVVHPSDYGILEVSPIHATRLEALSDAEDPMFEVVLKNSGGQPLEFNAAVSEAWLSLTTSSGIIQAGGKQRLLGRLLLGSLAAGAHTANIRIQNSGVSSSIDYPVFLELKNPGPKLARSTLSLHEISRPTLDSLERTIEIWNSGTGRLDFSATSDSPWVAVSPEQGSSSGERIPLRTVIDPAGKGPGQYFASLKIASNGEAPLVHIPVILTVFSADWFTNYAAARAAALAAGKPILVIAGRHSCPRTIQMRDYVSESDELGIASLLRQSFILWFADVDHDPDWPQLASRLEVGLLPVIVAVNPETGAIFGSPFGTDLSPARYVDWISQQAASLPLAPTFSAASALRQIVHLGQSLTLSVTATGNPAPEFQWMRNGQPLLGMTKSNFTITHATMRDSGWYQVVASNTIGKAVSPTLFVLVGPEKTEVITWGASAVNPPPDLSEVVAVSTGQQTPRSLALQVDGTPVEWGGGGDMPAGLSNVVAVDVGGDHSLALKADGTVVAWGYNSRGQADVPPELTNAVAIAAGLTHSLALKADGTVVSWGQYHAGYNNYVSIPAPAGLSNVIAIAAGDHSLALKADGRVVEWGSQWARGTDVPENATNVAAIAVGSYHSLAARVDGTVVAWGINGYGATELPPNLADVVSVAAGQYFSLALKADGTVVAWGWNDHGQTTLPAGLANVVAVSSGGSRSVVLRDAQSDVGPGGDELVPMMNARIAAGGYHSAALTPDGTLWQWGANREESRPTPVGSSGSWTAVAVGYNHFAALREDGSLWTWGHNYDGQLGDGSTEFKMNPVKMVAGNDWAAISAGQSCTVAVKRDGTLWVWGRGSVSLASEDPLRPGQLGRDSDWAGVAAGAEHAVAVKQNGTLWAWGRNWAGQLGQQEPLVEVKPVQVGTNDGWATVAAGWSHSLGLKRDGTLWAWGGNRHGQLGDGTTSNRSVPVQVGTSQDWAAVAAGHEHTLALKRDGTLWAWGDNGNGQLGGEINGQATVPLQVGDAADWAEITAGIVHSAAMRQDGTVWTWGGNSDGQLGDGTQGLKKTPVQIGQATDWAFVRAGVFHSVALKRDGTIWGWGSNDSLQSPGETSMHRSRPVQMSGATNSIAVAAGYRDTVVLRQDGSVWGWGSSIPTAVSGAADWVAVAAGDWHTVALRNDGTLWAWGDNSSGQLGDGSTQYGGNAVLVGSDSDWTAVTAGRSHTVAIKEDGTLWSWGNNFDGQLGDGTRTNKWRPVQVGNDRDWAIASSGGEHTVALKINGTLWTWGANWGGQLGDGAWDSKFAPVQVGIESDWAAVAAGGSHTCALKRDGTLWTWGPNWMGQLGVGTFDSTNRPVQVGSDRDWTAVTAGFYHTLALKADGTLWAWGDNGYGQLGDGTAWRATPELVLFPELPLIPDPPLNLSASPGGVEDHKILADGDNLYVVWSDSSPGNFDIFFRRSSDGGASWGPVINLSSNLSTSRHAELAVSGEMVFVAWGDYTDNFTRQNVLLRRSTDGGATFEAFQQLSDTPGYLAGMAASGFNVYVLLGEADGGAVLRRSSNAGASFHPAQILSSTGRAFEVGVNENGLYALAGDGIEFRRSSDGGVNFEPAQVLADFGNYPELALSGGTISVIWQAPGASGHDDVYFSHSSNGGLSFEPSKNLSGGSGNLPRLAMEGENVAVVWIGDGDILFRRSGDGGRSFDPPFNLSVNVGDSIYPRVAVSGSWVSVAWQDSLDVFLRASGDGGVTFNPVVNLSDDRSSALVEMAATSTNAYVIWKNFGAGGGDIFFRRVPLVKSEIERTMALSGDLSFGSIGIGTSAQRILTLRNNGNAPLTVYRIRYPYGFSGDWSGTIPPGTDQNVPVVFSPSSAQLYLGDVQLETDKTGGTDALPLSGTGVAVDPGPTGILHGVLDLDGSSIQGQRLGDGTNHVTLSWAYRPPGEGWLLGSDHNGDTDVALVPSIVEVSQIQSVAGLSFSADALAVAPGSFIVLKNINTSYAGVVRVLTIADGGLTGEWWFQTDGSGNFALAEPPKLRALFENGQVLLSWIEVPTVQFVLESSTALKSTATWRLRTEPLSAITLPSGRTVKSLALSLAGPTEFFRLRLEP